MNPKIGSGEGLRTFDGAVVVMTGGASGIGEAMGRELHRQGARLVIADRQIDRARALCEELNAEADRAEAVDIDVRQNDLFDLMIQGVFDRHGRLDFLFNNAGIGVGGDVLHHRVEDWKYTFEVDLLGVAHGVQAAYPRMVEQGFGHIVNTASMAGLLPTPQMAAYCAAKHGVVGLSRALRVEGKDLGVRVTALCPGVVKTPILLNGGQYGRMRMDLDERVQIMMWKMLRPMEADAFARKVIKKLKSNPGILIVPGWWRILWWLHRLSPAISNALAVINHRQFKDIIRQAEGEKSEEALPLVEGE